MIEPELEKHLSTIEAELRDIKQSSRLALGSQFLRGVAYGLGYVVGAVVVIAIVGWILNEIGVIPALTHFVGSIQHYLNSNSSFRA